MTEPALEIEDVSHAYGKRRALAGVSLSVDAGRFTALLGVNGAGKTTLFNLVTRLFDTQSGQITVCGHNLRTAPRSALASLGVVFQSRALDPALSVRQNLIYQGALHGLAKREALARGEALLAQVKLADRMADKVGTLSGGQLRRVEIVRALLNEPRLLLCDEATVGLDVVSRADIVAEVHSLAAERGIGVLWATHLIDEIRPDDAVVVLHEGIVKAAGQAADIAGDTSLDAAFRNLTDASAEAPA